MTLSYAIVTPARDEADNLRRLAECVRSQTRLPTVWVVVDSGSRDDTPAVVEALAREYPWIRLGRTPGVRRAAPGAPVVRAFHSGLSELDPLPDVVVKLDADVSLDHDFFERLLAEFALDPQLGIAGGGCRELVDGEWRQTRVTGEHVRGACRAYRRACLEAVLPLVESMGWDGVDELQARARGWTTRIVPNLDFRHHRRVGERDGAWHRRWRAQGAGAYAMGYRPLYLVLRTLHRARRNPAAVAMIGGYVAAAMRHAPRMQDAEARTLLRNEQRLRNLPARAREALGR
jgi:biofilm PGA synthesis N-glycosyltransferase PgaC